MIEHISQDDFTHIHRNRICDGTYRFIGKLGGSQSVSIMCQAMLFNPCHSHFLLGICYARSPMYHVISMFGHRSVHDYFFDFSKCYFSDRLTGFQSFSHFGHVESTITLRYVFLYHSACNGPVGIERKVRTARMTL